ncbi:hypothetical protein ACOMHN_016506 [Nucella lapillus]
MSNYQNLDREFAQMRVHHEQGSEFQRMPPATAPKPKPYPAAPAPFKSGGTGRRAVNVDTFPPPPPTGGMYAAQAKFVRQDDYNDFGPGPMTPPSRDRAMGRVVYSQDGRESPYSPLQNVSSGNYANIRINVAPPTPTNKEFDYGGVPSPPQQYRAEPIHKDAHQDRPIPGPQVPAGAPYGGGQISQSENRADKEAEVDALTDMLMKSMESAHQEDFFGICGHCEKEVTGESNGCSAMDQVFHVTCFTCVGCSE